MATLGEINLLENNIEDPNAQENFRRIKTFLRDTPIMKSGFFFRTFDIPAGLVTNFKFRHNLDFQPKDVIVTSITNNATVTWHYEQFTRNFIVLTVSAATTIRVLLGAYKDDNS